ncbi:MAG TPA: DUF402 domain-containing protein [Anaerolineaceae bacterium]|nr:DUF402 domain-containing protein [Anaerolineaceae bacterium]
MDDIVVRKLNYWGEETWRYSGKVLERGAEAVRLEAFFNREDLPFHEIVLGKGDRFVETFFSDRWYNIFEIHDRADGRLKAWYCNVGRPAVIRDGEVSYVDLALDLLVYPDGRQLALDEDEFNELPLSPEEQQKCREALAELTAIFHRESAGE